MHDEDTGFDDGDDEVSCREGFLEVPLTFYTLQDYEEEDAEGGTD
jgi:hypothetical protein